MAKRMTQQQFIDAVQMLLPSCQDPMELKRKLEEDIGAMGLAETYQYLAAYEQTGDLLAELHEAHPKNIDRGHDVTNTPLLRGVIDTRGRGAESGQRHRPTEEIAGRSVDRERGK